MNRLEKAKSLALKKADAAADIELINRYSLKELTPDEVYCFSVVLCDNDVDRDLERFTDETLEKFAELFVGKTGISDHRWSCDRQIARLYRVEVEEGRGKNALGQPLKLLRGSAYMLKNEASKPIIEAIEGGIVKEVSIGCAIKKQGCSVCGESFSYNWCAGGYECENGHLKGERYDGKLCACELSEPTDAYEFSFVAVPAQRSAGVTKNAQNISEAFELLLTADLSGEAEKVRELVEKLMRAAASKEEKEKRAAIIAENKKFLKGRCN